MSMSIKSGLFVPHLLEKLPKKISIFEVGPRDGLQNIKKIIETKQKFEMIRLLVDAGFKEIEVSSFVKPSLIPQFADASQLNTMLLNEKKFESVNFTSLVPNTNGLAKANECGVKNIALFVSASQGFSKANINCSVEESLDRCAQVVEECKAKSMRVRGYVSCVIGCPYSGPVEPEKVLEVTKKLLDLGCYQVSLGDTIGVGTASSVSNLLGHLVSEVDPTKLAAHFHDTYGQALTNVLVALSHGIATVDSSLCGLGGCPFAKSATGNLATEDLIYMLNDIGLQTGIDIDRMLLASDYVTKLLPEYSVSRAAKALLKNRATKTHSQ